MNLRHSHRHRMSDILMAKLTTFDIPIVDGNSKAFWITNYIGHTSFTQTQASGFKVAKKVFGFERGWTEMSQIYSLEVGMVIAGCITMQNLSGTTTSNCEFKYSSLSNSNFWCRKPHAGKYVMYGSENSFQHS